MSDKIIQLNEGIIKQELKEDRVNLLLPFFIWLLTPCKALLPFLF